jgi:hypothetical protein
MSFCVAEDDIFCHFSYTEVIHFVFTFLNVFGKKRISLSDLKEISAKANDEWRLNCILEEQIR